ncbi:MAG: TIGR02466 family protein [Algiphilus sp.]|uniref:TIGR02466 family protein n=1 Tax=Algiphilus sp. TaxID=1872431 RepID=UPI0025B83689|nr:TIGR02466 family protein [Algiphilus sp.]MCI5103587.1 TIGR02466 family protein [Algiphilus sp.]
MSAGRSAVERDADTRALFPTLVYDAALGARGVRALNEELVREAYQIAEVDTAGQDWSAQSYPGGYTSYSSLDQLHRMSPSVMTLARHLTRHAQRFAQRLHWDIGEGALVMSDCWVSIMGEGCGHPGHLHPLAVVSGTYYAAAPRGASGLRFEDPRLANFMAAPPRSAEAPEHLRPHVLLPARSGRLYLFESWLRHEVPPSAVSEDRISFSFNFVWE